jgi:hypothetical protein
LFAVSLCLTFSGFSFCLCLTGAFLSLSAQPFLSLSAQPFLQLEFLLLPLPKFNLGLTTSLVSFCLPATGLCLLFAVSLCLTFSGFSFCLCLTGAFLSLSAQPFLQLEFLLPAFCGGFGLKSFLLLPLPKFNLCLVGLSAQPFLLSPLPKFTFSLLLAVLFCLMLALLLLVMLLALLSSKNRIQ